jgi:hypothetical protein
LERDRSEIFLNSYKGFEADFAAALSSLLTMKAICDHNNIRLSVVIIPDEVQISRSLQKSVVLASGLAKEAFDFTLPNRRLAAALQNHGIDFIDLYDGFAAAPADVRLYRPNDTHWNIKGNLLAAEMIQQGLFSHLIPLQRQ